MTQSAPFPWDEALHFGLGILRWPPSAFWRATPRELAAAATPPRHAGSALERSTLAALIARYPDGDPGDP